MKDRRKIFLRVYEPQVKEVNGEMEPFQKVFTQRNACYFPIPFAERCKVVWVGDRNPHIFISGGSALRRTAEVRTFTPEDIPQCMETIQRFNPGVCILMGNGNV